MAPKVNTIDVDGSESAYYAPATIAKFQDLIHISGQIHLALLNLQRVLVAANTSADDLLKLTIYIVNYDPKKRKHVRHIRKVLGKHRPAITLVPVTQLAQPGWLFEVDAIAARYPVLVPKSLSTTEKVDVVVIGAGLAGLTAAERVIRAGYSCRVLEARDRVGGRTWTQKQLSGGVIDLGAAWINDTNQSNMIGLARRFGAELITQNIDGEVILDDGTELKHFPYGGLPGFPENTRKHLAHIRDTVEADCQKLALEISIDSQTNELDSLTFLAYLEKLGASDEAIATATVWTRAMLGQDPADISAFFFLQYCKSGGGLMQMRSDGKHGGQYLRFREGTQMIANNIARSLPKVIDFNSPAVSIEHLGSEGVRINGIQARKAICTIPPPAMKKVSFRPPLPASKRLLFDSYRYGYYQKVMVVFKSPFWNSLGSCGLAQSFVGPAAVFRDTSSASDGLYVLTCFVAGSVGQTWSEMAERQREESLLKQLENIFGNIVRSEYVEMIGHQWNDEEWNGYGCPASSTAPGVLSVVGKELKTSFGDVHFAGTETSDVWKGYMEGAVRSGIREADLVTTELRGISAKL